MKYIGAMLVAAPLVCSAASQNLANQVSCTGTLTTDSTNGLQIDCTGSLTLVGGSLTSDSSIKLTASDTLFLDNITVTAPTINLSGGNTVSIGNSVKIDISNLNINVMGNSTLVDPVSGALPNGVVLTASGGDNVRPIIDPGVIIHGPIVRFPEPVIQLQVGGGSCSSSGIPSVFQIVESGTRFCADGKKDYHQIWFLRTTAECHTAPTNFEIAPTQDFPTDDSTQNITADCHNNGAENSSCFISDATEGSTNLTQPTAGRLTLKWGRNGKIHKLVGHIIEKSLDGCHSESTLKFIKKID
jgi:hypothetical protein